ncbi:phosphodiester glycosidase family protein [Thermus sp. PS18]|uniref:phosphodiester glycosidase family protein n=1 Tax=Thermus sp. PS18 TaxID=2849039 RepID=UPI002264FA75|nr:phosphodiester glycosidase family protein [Thermus sp. PS18]UZX15946.1 phosphodiester glycosidase family protein [Thermus sp. PS18]
MRLLALLLFFSCSLAQTLLPASTFGLSFREEAGAWIYEGEGVRFVYVPGVGWAEPLEPALPPPDGERMSLEALKALGYFRTPEAGVRHGTQGRALRLVLDLPGPEPAPKPPSEGQAPGSLSLLLPYLAPGMTQVPWPKGMEARVRLLPGGTELTLSFPGKLLRYRLFPLKDPERLVLDLYVLEAEVEEPLAPGVRYREIWAFTPEPLRLYLVEAERGTLIPVGRPGMRALPKDLAPNALAVLNGGYFDPKTATPIGLWVQDGVTVSYPSGRTALLWDSFSFFLGVPRFEATIQGPSGERVRVGINASRARYTAHTVPGPVGKEGEEVALVMGNRVQAILPAPQELPPGAWALTFPKGALPFPLKPGDTLSLYGRLDPPFRYALEAGPLLVQEGQYAFDPSRENFRDPRPLQAIAPQAAVAWTREGKLWLLVSEPTTPGVLARALLSLGAWNALRMDGGGSAQLWVKDKLRSPYQGSPRPVVSALALYAP